MLRKPIVGLLCNVVLVASAEAIDIQFDYGLDTSNFFGGPARMATLDAAAGFFEDLLTDRLLPISPTSENSWSALFTHPSAGSITTVINLFVPADTLVVYVGARDLTRLGSDVLAQSGFGLTATGSQQWVDTVLERGQGDVVGPTAADYATWGGAISFNAARTWHNSHATQPQPNAVDLYSVALHELGHLLGFGHDELVPGFTTSWSNQVDGSAFTGAASRQLFEGNVPLDEESENWEDGTPSFIYSTQTPQDVAMDGALLLGTREHFTELDVAALVDIGWQVGPLPPASDGDYNSDQIVNAADYTVWRNTLNSNTDLRADGNGDLVVNDLDYDIWKNALGTAVSVSALSHLGNVPEPSSIVCMAIVVPTSLLWRRRWLN